MRRLLFILIVLCAASCQGSENDLAYNSLEEDTFFDNDDDRLTSLDCVAEPPNDQTNLINEGDPVLIKCKFDTELQNCTWTHYDPAREDDSENSLPDITCFASKLGGNATTSKCPGNGRIEQTISGSTCGIVISKARSTDSGLWRLRAAETGAASNTSGPMMDTEVEIFTFSRSALALLDDQRRDVTDEHVHNTYNCDEEERDCPWARAVFTCRSFGARPDPYFNWTIGRATEDLRRVPDIFQITEAERYCSDEQAQLCESESTIAFDVDDRLMQKLRDYDLYVHEDLSMVQFDLFCLSHQKGTAEFVANRVSVQLMIQRRYEHDSSVADALKPVLYLLVLAMSSRLM